MSNYEVPQPILNSPFEEPKEHWHIVEDEMPVRLPGRRRAIYFYRDPKAKPSRADGQTTGTAIELKLVTLMRDRLASWRKEGFPGVSRTTMELLSWWRRDGREQRLFFAQLEAAETIVFLIEARTDFLQGIEIPRDDPGEEKKAEGYAG